MTRPTDFCGCPVTLAPGPAVGAWDDTQRAFLAHGARTPERLAETLRLAPDFALAHAARGILLPAARAARDG